MSTGHSLAALAEELSRAHLLCLGDVMLDRYVGGDVSRISPEAPIPVLRAKDEKTVLGGAGNVVRNLVALGARVTLVGVVGDDGRGRQLVEMVEALKGARAALSVEPRRPTSLKTRFLSLSQQLLRVDEESDAPLAEAVQHEVIDAVRRHLVDTDALVLSDYGKGVLCLPVLKEVLRLAQEAGRDVFVDPKGTDYSRYRGARVLTPNLKELHEATGMPVQGEEAIVAAARRLIEVVGARAILATRGKDGMSLVEAGGVVSHLPARAREVFDVSGAGDTVIATLAAASAVGATLEDAARLANVAAEVVVGKVGTAAVHTQDLIEALHARDLWRAEAKVLPLVAAVDRVETWRRKGFRVGFTNGCFDLLHPGHLSMLRQAAARCDRLIVGLNSDDSVRALKGEGRPVQNETSRAAVVASLEVVDMVVIFHEETPEKILQALRPDVLVKGADYRREEVVGGDFVASYGGEVFLAQIEEGHSTTRTIARIAGEDS